MQFTKLVKMEISKTMAILIFSTLPLFLGMAKSFSISSINLFSQEFYFLRNFNSILIIPTIIKKILFWYMMIDLFSPSLCLRSSEDFRRSD